MAGATGDDEFVEWIAAVVAGVAENQAGGVEGDFRPAIPSGWRGAAEHVAVGTIDGEIGADAGLHGKGSFIGPEVTWEQIGRAGHGAGEEGILAENVELVAGKSEDARLAVELAGVE